MRYYENDEFKIPKIYRVMSAKQLNILCRVYEMFHKFVSKYRRSSKRDKLKEMGIKVNL